MAQRRRRKISPPAGSSNGEPLPEEAANDPAPKRRRPAGAEQKADDPLLGSTLGKCRIEQYIGEGKTSVVYRAHYQPLKRTVAVKVLLDKMAKIPAVLRVFQREGRAVAALDHENILKIYDVGEDKERYFLVLELLRGKELREHIDGAEDGRLELGEALDFTRQAARGLAAAHRKNLIHRDIKPQNLVVEPDGTLKIVDFGLAAEAEGAFAGGRLGTPHYMAPEQCRGELAGTASDVYALGITLYHMLIGKAPYAGAKTTEEIIERHLEGKRLEPEKVRKGLPGSVCELIRRMTRSNAKQRPSAQEVAEAIDKLMKGGGQARQRGGGGRRRAATASKPDRTPVFIGIGVAVVAAVIGLFLMGGDSPEETPEPEPAVASNPPVDPAPAVKKDDGDKKPELELGPDAELNQLLKAAQQEESTGNFMEALHLYTRVRDKSKDDTESIYYRQAIAAIDSVRKAIRAEKSGTRAKRVTLKGTELAGAEFDERRPELRKMLASFQVDPVQAELDALLARTRKGTPERDRIQHMIDEMRYLVDLLGILKGRVAGMSANDADWKKFDRNFPEGWVLMSVDQAGITLKNLDAGSEQTRAWAQLPPIAIITLLDATRSPTSGMDALRVGYYCLLLGDDRSEIYFEMARKLDPGLGPDIEKILADPPAGEASGED